MKKFVSISLVAMICISFVSAIVTVLRYEKYVKTSQELLWDLEALCEAHDIDWGDTICEAAICERGIPYYEDIDFGS